MRIWQSGDFWYTDLDGGVQAFNTAQEAAMTTAKILFVQALQSQATALAQAGAVLDDMAEVYVDREYGTTNPFTAEDLATTGLTVEQVTAMIAIVPTFLTFVDTPTVRAALNDMRTDL